MSLKRMCDNFRSYGGLTPTYLLDWVYDDVQVIASRSVPDMLGMFNWLRDEMYIFLRREVAI